MVGMEALPQMLIMILYFVEMICPILIKDLMVYQKSHLNSSGDLVPANVNGLYKGREVTVAEHILGGYRKGAKGNSPYTSFTYANGIVTNYGNTVIKVDIKGLIDDVAKGKLKDVEVLTPIKVKEAIKSDTQLNYYWRNLALKWATRDNEWANKGRYTQRLHND